ncbi:TRAP transporter small permease [Rhodoplanes sp. Z2-YC6860]|uniref:TRAP transporter small permease n=1 Tax=Rhodoplanes sp. Z2-YC6860 TaxID=674703 RepID=UPI00078B6A95|nr:TRAP transporter small permease [Rhodoplanes sp. Z2-YC6860]AMN44617.1 tripartite ATP-independent periplasmic transporter DctQ [Rhodoplanes sp. Z2-YC6860]
MAHGLDPAETGPTAAPPTGAAGIEYWFSILNQLIVLIASIALVGASLVLTYSVIVRYFLHISTDWQDEMSVFLIIGAVFMSSAAIQARRGHVAIEAISSMLPPHVNRIRLAIVDIMSLAFCGFFAWKSWTLLEEAWTENFHSGSSWGPPLWVPYSLMTFGMMLLTLQILLQVANALLSRRTPA